MSTTFTEFYQAYPRKMARKEAEKAWNRMTPEERGRAMDALPNHIRYWEASNTGREFIPYPATWLRRGGWLDELGPQDFYQAKL